MLGLALHDTLMGRTCCPWNLSSWSSGHGCFSFLPDFDSHSVRGPFSLIQILTFKLLHTRYMETRKVSGPVCSHYSSPKFPHQLPQGHYFFSHHFWTWNTLVFFLPLEWLTPAVAVTDFLSNPILPAFSLMEILHTTGQ